MFTMTVLIPFPLPSTYKGKDTIRGDAELITHYVCHRHRKGGIGGRAGLYIYLSNEEWHFVTVKLVSDITFDIDKSHC